MLKQQDGQGYIIAQYMHHVDDYFKNCVEELLFKHATVGLV